MSVQAEEVQIWEKWKRHNLREPCPFCNSDVTFVAQHSVTGRWRVICNDCAAQGPITTSIDRSLAIELWNKNRKRS